MNTQAPVRQAEHVKYDALLTAAGVHAIPAINADKAEVWKLLDTVGVARVCERIATGMLPNEVALDLGVPIMMFRRWLEDQLPMDQSDAVRAAAAESLMLKAQLVLSAQLKTPAEASQAKALAAQFTEMAKAMDPKSWSPAHLEAQRRPPSVSITFVSDSGTTTISGRPVPADERPHAAPPSVPPDALDTVAYQPLEPEIPATEVASRGPAPHADSAPSPAPTGGGDAPPVTIVDPDRERRSAW